MKAHKRILLIILLLSISACGSGTGGIIGNLIPAPKFLDGEVKEGIYYSPDNAFNVQIPHPPGNKDDNYEWTYTKIHEIKDQAVIGIVFGPAAFDRNLYHAVLIRMPMPATGDKREDYVKDLFKKKSESRNVNALEQHFSKWQHGSKTTYYAVYSGSNSYHVFSLTDNNGSFYVLEADIIPDSIMDGFTDLEQLKNKGWDRFNAMQNSFNVTSASYQP